MKHSQSIIILHGWGLSGSKFSGLKKALASKGFHVYAPDFPGFGSSEMPQKPYTLSDYADFIHSYISEHSIKNPVIIGHSFGGRVALKYDHVRPGQFRAMILTGTPGYTPVPRKKLAAFIAIAKIGKAVSSVWPINLVQDSVRKWYYYAVGAREFYRAQGVMRDTFKNIVREQLTDCMKTVSCPTLLLWGQEDVITPVWIAHKMHEMIGGSKLHITGGIGHAYPYADPAGFAAVASSFIDSI